MINQTKELKSFLRLMNDEFKNTGSIFNSVSGEIKTLSGDFERLNKDISILKSGTVSLQPEMSELINTIQILNSSIREFAGYLKNISSNELENYTVKIRDISAGNNETEESFKELIPQISGVITILSGLIIVSEKIGTAFAGTNSITLIFTGAIAATIANLQMLTVVIENISNGESIWKNLSDNLIGGLIKSLFNLGNASDNTRLKLMDLKNSVSMLQQEWDNTVISFSGFNWQESKKQTDQTLANIKTQTANLKELRQSLNNLLKEQETATGENLKNINKNIQKVRNEINKISGTAITVNKTSGRNTGIPDEKNFLENFRDKVQKLKDEINELVLLSKVDNLLDYEKLEIAEELLRKNRELSKLLREQTIEQRSLISSETLENLNSLINRSGREGKQGKNKNDFSVRKTAAMANLDPHIEFAKRMQEIYDGMANGVVGSMGNLFASLVPPQAALSPLEQFMKQIVITFINAVQGLVLAAAAALPAKGITTFGISMITDAPLLAAAYAALEIAKGFIGRFAKGTDYLQKSGYALVGEQGPELVYLNRGAKVFNNNETSKMLNSARANTAPNTNVNNVYISSSLDALSFFRVNYPKYKKFKRLQSN